MTASMTALIHGPSGVGKTWLVGVTPPGPRLLLDVEGRSKAIPIEKTLWDPNLDPPPDDLDPNATVVVNVKDWPTFTNAWQWIRARKHPFQSVAIDSLMELQARNIEHLFGREALRIQDWGDVLRDIEGIVREGRDLTNTDQETYLQSMIYVAGSWNRDNKELPILRGQLADKIAFHCDVVGYYYTVQSEDGLPVRRLLLAPFPGYTAKDGLGCFGTHVDRPHIGRMLEHAANTPAQLPEDWQ